MICLSSHRDHLSIHSLYFVSLIILPCFRENDIERFWKGRTKFQLSLIEGKKLSFLSSYFPILKAKKYSLYRPSLLRPKLR